MSAVGNVLVWPFRNPEERRLRWGWRFFIPAVFLSGLLTQTGGLGDLIAAPLVPFLERLTPEYTDISQQLAIMIARSLIVVVFLVLWARFVDRRRISDYGFHINREWLAHLLGGMLIGLSIPVVTTVAMLALGWATVADLGSFGVAFAFATVVGLLAALLNGFWEETLYRGVALKNAAEGMRSMGLSPRVAVLGALMLVSLAFVFLHGGFTGGLPRFLYYAVASLALGLVYILTGELAFPIGFHAAYNYFSAVVLTPSPVPGAPTAVVLETTGSAPQLFVGRVGGVGLLETIVIASSLLAMLLWVRWRKGNLEIETGIAEWTPRGARKPHNESPVR